jgi:hypothetical protein
MLLEKERLGSGMSGKVQFFKGLNRYILIQ